MPAWMKAEAAAAGGEGRIGAPQDTRKTDVGTLPEVTNLQYIHVFLKLFLLFIFKLNSWTSRK
jgi:hypothetical protein